jgi:hypothetical protein
VFKARPCKSFPPNSSFRWQNQIKSSLVPSQKKLSAAYCVVMSFKLISSGSNSANRQTKKTTPIRESLNNEEDSFCDENLTSQTRNNERGKSTEKDGILKRVLPGQKIQFFCQCFYKHDPEKLMQESSKFLRHFFVVRSEIKFHEICYSKSVNSID